MTAYGGRPCFACDDPEKRPVADVLAERVEAFLKDPKGEFALPICEGHGEEMEAQCTPLDELSDRKLEELEREAEEAENSGKGWVYRDPKELA